MARLSEDLVKEVHKLLECFSLDIANEEYFPERFGDGILTMTGGTLAFRILRERLEVFVDVKRGGGEWTDVEAELRRLQLHPTPHQRLQVSELVDAVCEHARDFALST